MLPKKSLKYRFCNHQKKREELKKNKTKIEFQILISKKLSF
ncbi:hypothetical protein DOY81_001100 [Sarcophaga bullata]|nr:hypothetical protein DOY81_001100 [Sarcophaga bullata]